MAKSDIHTWIYPWISISTATLAFILLFASKLKVLSLRRFFYTYVNDIFMYTLVFLHRILDHRIGLILVGFGMLVVMVPTYPVMTLCRFPTFVALCDHSPPTLQTDRQTDRRHAGSYSVRATCYTGQIQRDQQMLRRNWSQTC